MEWANMRIERSVMVRLDGFRRRLERLAAEGRMESDGFADRNRVSLSEAVAVLLRRDAEHSERSRRARGNRAGKKPADSVDSVYTPADGTGG